MQQKTITDEQQEFFTEMKHLIKTLRRSVDNAEILHNQINSYNKTLARIEEKTDHINTYILKTTQEQIKQRDQQTWKQ